VALADGVEEEGWDGIRGPGRDGCEGREKRRRVIYRGGGRQKKKEGGSRAVAGGSRLTLKSFLIWAPCASSDLVGGCGPGFVQEKTTQGGKKKGDDVAG
jgi:hypothetical protein